MTKTNCYLSLATLIMCSPNLLAALAVTETRVDETIVVTGTKTAKLLSNSPVDITVIEKSQIEMISQGTVVDVLDLIPGVVVSRNQKDGYNVLMNGFDSKHVSVLLDGLPLISPTGSSVDLDQLSAVNIAQIEVMRGPGSVLYGSHAMGGVINIITDKSLNTSNLNYQVGQFVNNTSDADTGADAFNQILKFSAGKQFGGWLTKANLQYIHEAALDFDPQDIKQNNADFTKVFLTLDTFGSVGGLDTYIKYQRFDEDKKRIEGVHPALGINLYSSEAQQDQAEFKVESRDDFWFVQGRFMGHQELSGQASGLRNADIGINQISAQKAWQVGSINPKTAFQSGGETVFGLDARFDDLSQIKSDGTIEVDSKSREAIEAFLQHNLIFHNQQYLLGIRVQEDSDFGFHKALRASAMWKAGSKKSPVSFRLGLGEGYRVPDLKERFFFFDHSNLGYMILGNEALTPEQSLGLTSSVNFKHSFSNWDLELDVSGHYSDIEDLIVTDLVSQENGINISEYVNVAEATIYGFDLGAATTFQNWRFQINYAYTEALDGSDARLPERPRHQVKTDLNYELTALDIDLSLYAVYQSDYATSSSFLGNAVDSFTTVNLRLKQAINKSLSWNMAINNLTDEHLSLSAQAQGLYDPRPRSTAEIKLGLEYQF